MSMVNEFIKLNKYKVYFLKKQVFFFKKISKSINDALARMLVF